MRWEGVPLGYMGRWESVPLGIWEGGVYTGLYASLGMYGVYIALLYMSRSVHVRHAVIDCPDVTVLSLVPKRGASSGEEKTVLRG